VSFDIASLSRTGGRAENEDYADFLQTPAATCWVLADGLGGHRGGATASKAVVEAALASFRDRPEATPDAVRAHIAQAQATLGVLQSTNPALAQMRSTIVILVSTGRASVWGHVGDSRLYHLRGGQIVARTRDHSVSQALVDVGQVDAHDQGAHEDRSRLLRCLGKEDAEAGATVSGPHALARGDAFLLCTDGFWEALDDVALALDCAGAEDAGAWVARMEARLRRRERPAHDNYTATAIRLTDDGLPEAPPHDPRQPVQAVARDDAAAHASGGRAAGAGGRRRRAGLTAVATGPGVAVVAAIVGLLFIAGVTIGIWQRPAVGAWIKRLWTSTPAVKTEPVKTEPAKTQPTETQPSSSDPSGPEAPPLQQPLPPSATDAKPPANSGVAPVVPIGSGKGKGTDAGKETPQAKETFADPSALPARVLFRPAAGLRYTSLQAAIRAAAPGETIWIGPGELKEAIAPIAQALTLKGAGRDVTRLNLAGLHGLVLTGPEGGLEDLEVCCAASDAVLEIAGTFRGAITRVRIRKGAGWGIVIRGSAAPAIADTLIDDNPKGRISVREQATLTLR
jgi:serine/threonine protein phosphatase PrpC